MKSNWARILMILLVCWGVHTPSFAQQDVTAHAKLDAVDITVGDQIRMFIEVQNKGTGKLQWALFPDTFNHLEIVEKGKIDTLQQGGATVYKQRLLLTGFDSGLFKVPAFQFAVIPAAGDPYTVQTDSFLVAVTTVPVDTSQPFRGIKNIIFVKADHTMLYVGIAMGLALIGLLLYLFLKWRKKKPQPEVVVPQEPLHLRTLRLLDELDHQKLWQSGNVKQYYVSLTDILRAYIEERFKTPALELTTDELLSKTHEHKEMNRHYDELAQILTTADLAKFAKAQPLPFEHTQTMELTRNFVTHTQPVIVETNQPAT